jgi:hypothetical protein
MHPFAQLVQILVEDKKYPLLHAEHTPAEVQVLQLSGQIILHRFDEVK